MINKMTASFGKLNGDSLSFGDGLNIVCAPNESGKSTWCAFIRAMLYGVDSAERQKNGHLPDKLRYLPWSGAVMQGSMELSSGGRDITISRTTRLKSAPVREFSAVYSGTNVPVEGLSTVNVGETLTGVGREVFRRSAFIEQDGISISANPELEKRIAAIVSTGEEDCSYTEADERLRAWQRKRKYNRRGILPELEEKIAREESRLRELSYSSDEIDRLSARLEESERRCEMLERQMLESRKTARKDALSSLHDIRTEYTAAEAEYNKAKAAADTCKAELLNSPVSPDGDMSRERFDRDRRSMASLITTANKKISSLPAVLLILLALACAVAGVLTYPILYAVAAVLLLAAVLLFVSCGKKKKAAAEAKAEARTLLGVYGASDIDEAEDNFEEYLLLKKRSEDADAALLCSENALKGAALRRERTEAETLSALDFSDGSGAAAEIGRQLATERQLRDTVAARLSEAKGRLTVMGDPLVIGSALGKMRSDYAEISEEYAAISLAVDALRAADAEIQSRFSPALGKKAAEYFSFMTDGKYDSVLINRDFGVCVGTPDGSVAVDSAYLSAGARDLMYLAVRLAVCELALPEDTVCPLILDDTLSNLDTERTERALMLLREIAKKRQVILFTCRPLR